MWIDRRKQNTSLTVALLCCVISGCSESPTRMVQFVKPTLATVTGRVFLITQGGDLKPARLANVYLLGADALPDQKTLRNKVGVLNVQCQGAEQQRQVMLSNSIVAGQAAQFERRDLSEYKDGLNQLEKMFSSGTGEKDAFSVQADEEGRFSFDRVPFGSYIIAAFGQGGVILAYWAQPLQIAATEPPVVRLSQPVTACSVF